MAARRHIGEAVLCHGLEEYEDRSGLCRARVDQLLAAAKLASRDIVLHGGYDHRDDGPWQRRACRLCDHSRLQDLRLDLPKAGLQRTLAGALRDQYAGRTHQRIDDVAGPQEELLDPPIDTGTNDGLVELVLGLRQLGL